MLKRLTLKLFSLFILCAALMSVASAPRPVAKGVFCMDAPMLRWKWVALVESCAALSTIPSVCVPEIRGRIRRINEGGKD